MRTIAIEAAERILNIEEEAVARFYDHVNLGEEYRAADTSSEVRRMVREFRESGYKISRLEIGDESTFRMTLYHNGVVCAWQDITVDVTLSPMGGV